MRILGGTEKDIPEGRRASLKVQRNPARHNGNAKNLFAADLMAISSGKMSLEVEEVEKELLRINEHLGLRGPHIDRVVAEAQSEALDKITESAIADLDGMTLTLVDGDFPRQVIANQNLGFAEYKMPASRNKASQYDSKTHGEPAQTRYGNDGIRVGQLDLEVWEAQKHAAVTRNWMILIGCFSIGLVWTIRRRRV